MSYRLERKYVLTPLSIKEMEVFIKLHPLNIKKTYEDRVINSIYYDTEDFKMYFQNINGDSERKKIRVRWYGRETENIVNPKLEIKVRNTYLGKKVSYDIKKYDLIQNIKNFLNEKDYEEVKILEFEELKPKVLVRYVRKYFESSDRKVRITLDTGLEFSKIDLKLPQKFEKFKKIEDEIIEIKYSIENQKEALDLMNKIPLRLTRYSKYVRGIQEVY